MRDKQKRYLRSAKRKTMTNQAISRKNWKLLKNIKIIRSTFVRYDFNPYRNNGNWHSVSFDLESSRKVRKSSDILCQKPEKPKGLFWSQVQLTKNIKKWLRLCSEMQPLRSKWRPDSESSWNSVQNKFLPKSEVPF